MEYVIVRARDRRRAAVQQRQETLALHRALKDMTNPFADPRFQSVYRLTPDMALTLIEEIRPYYPDTHSSAAIPIEIKVSKRTLELILSSVLGAANNTTESTFYFIGRREECRQLRHKLKQVLAALHFFGQGSYQKADGRDAFISISQPSISRAIAETTMALNMPQVLCKWIKFPCEVNKRQQIILQNYISFGFPGVVGYVDGTHILLKKPSVHEELYINRKGQHSLNVQMACDSELLILSICAKYPGSTHDAFVWRSSSLRDKMMQLQNSSCWLLGDSGYPLEPWLLTPVLNAEVDSPEARYTALHIRSRNCIERCFGVLKARFRCLHKNRVLEYTPTKVGCITNACAVLHNMCIRARIAEPEDIDLEDPLPIEIFAGPGAEDALYNRGLQTRANLINRLF